MHLYSWMHGLGLQKKSDQMAIRSGTPPQGSHHIQCSVVVLIIWRFGENKMIKLTIEALLGVICAGVI